MKLTPPAGNNDMQIKSLINNNNYYLRPSSILQYGDGDQVPGRPANVTSVSLLPADLSLQGAWN